ncbi:hypothetical protein [Tsuneonella sp. HG222]
MPEALRQPQPASVQDQRVATRRPSLVIESEANNNVRLLAPEARLFELPSAVWITMVGS